MLTSTSNNLDRPFLPDTAFSHQAKNQCILGSDSNSHDFANNELESRIYEEVHMNEGNYRVSNLCIWNQEIFNPNIFDIIQTT